MGRHEVTSELIGNGEDRTIMNGIRPSTEVNQYIELMQRCSLYLSKKTISFIDPRELFHYYRLFTKIVYCYNIYIMRAKNNYVNYIY